MTKRKVSRELTNSALQEHSTRAVRFGYWSFLLGPLTLLPALFYWFQAERASKGSRGDRKLVSKAREGRNVAVFAGIVWTLILVIQVGGGTG
jgi:hypothetical protein